MTLAGSWSVVSNAHIQAFAQKLVAFETIAKKTHKTETKTKKRCPRAANNVSRIFKSTSTRSHVHARFQKKKNEICNYKKIPAGDFSPFRFQTIQKISPATNYEYICVFYWFKNKKICDCNHFTEMVSQRIFRHDLPYHSSKQWSFPTYIFLSNDLFRQPPSSLLTFWTSRFWTGLLRDQPLPLFACSLKYTWSIMAFDLGGRFLLVFPHVTHVLLLSIHLFVVHINRWSELLMHIKAFPCWYFSHPLSNITSFPKTASQWVTKKVPFKRNHKIVSIIPIFWSVSCRNLDPHFWAIVTIWELRSSWPACTLKLRHFFLQPYQEYFAAAI